MSAITGAEKPIRARAKAKSTNRLRRRTFGGFRTVNRLAANPGTHFSTAQKGLLGDGAKCSGLGDDWLGGLESVSSSSIIPRADRGRRIGTSCLAKGQTPISPAGVEIKQKIPWHESAGL